MVSMCKLLIGERSGGSGGSKAEKSEPGVPRRELLLRNTLVQRKDVSTNIWAQKTLMLNIGKIHLEAEYFLGA